MHLFIIEYKEIKYPFFSNGLASQPLLVSCNFDKFLFI